MNAPFRVRLTGSSAGTLDSVIVQIELVDRAKGCSLPGGPWQLFEPESLDAIYTDGDPAFWPDTSGNGRDIDGVIIGSAADPAPYRPNLLNGYGGIVLTGTEYDAGYDAGTYYFDRDEPFDTQVVGDGLSIVMVVQTTTVWEPQVWNPFSPTGWALSVEAGDVNFGATSGSDTSFVSAPAPGGWAVLSGSVDSAGLARLWINGQEADVVSGGFTATVQHLVTFYYGGDGLVFQGIWARAFTAQEHADAHCALMAKFGIT